MSVKVGILTFHRALNYGAVMQTYALQTFLEAKGCNVEIIDYYPAFLRSAYKKNPKRPYGFIFKLLQRRSFNEFLLKNLHLSKEVITDKQKLQDYAKNFDAIITGSDTVWNSHIVGDELDTYLLNFVQPPIKKISYAASIGGGDTDSAIGARFKTALKDFHAISLREEELCGKLSAISGRQVVDVADPTFLLTSEDYSKLCFSGQPRKTHGDYIVLFDLANDAFAKDCVSVIKRKLGLPIINIGVKYEKVAYYNPLNISPSKWLSYIRNARFVCTNSFHATTLSIIFKTPFVSLPVTVGPRSLNNVRMINILQKTGLSGQYVDSMEGLEDKISVNFDEVQGTIDAYVQRSERYLSSALGI